MTETLKGIQAQKTILVVEDEKSLRDAIVDILRRNNFIPLKAKNGREGVEVALSQHPDLILLDLVMPEMDGVVALKNIRLDAWGAHVPVIVLTNVSVVGRQLIEDMPTEQPLDYLVKSNWKIHDVVQKIEQTLMGTNRKI